MVNLLSFGSIIQAGREIGARFAPRDRPEGGNHFVFDASAEIIAALRHGCVREVPDFGEAFADFA